MCEDNIVCVKAHLYFIGFYIRLSPGGDNALWFWAEHSDSATLHPGV